MKTLRFLALLPLAAALTAFPLYAGNDDTAAYYKAHFDENVGKSIDVDVVTMRVLPIDIGEGFFAFAVWTWDDDANSGGGGIAVVAPADKKESLLRKYGTSVEWDGRRDPETKSLRGTLQSVPNPQNIGAYIPYIDLTDGAFEPNGDFGNVANVPNRPGRR